jgi:tetratricopeptide (TPR) repeat protein
MRAAAAALAEAEELLRQGRKSEAEGKFRAVLAAAPAHPVALHWLSLLAKEKGDFQAAEMLLRQAIAAAPQEAAFHNNLGNLLRARARAEAAEACYRDALSLNPDYAEAAFNLGVALKDQKRFDEALASFARAAELRPGYAEAHTQIAALLREAKRFADALAQLDLALAAQPDYFAARYYRGIVLSALERHADAADELRRAVQLNPASHEAHYALANALQYLGRLDEALQSYWAAIQAEPGSVAAHYDFNLLAWTMGRKDLHGRSYGHARRLAGDRPDLLLAEAELRMKFNQYDGAEQLLRLAQEQAPERGDLAAALARSLAGQKKFEASYPFFAAAVASEPASLAHRQNFAAACLRDGQLKDAIRLFEEARALAPYDQLTLGGLSLAYRQTGDSRYAGLVAPERYVKLYEIRVPGFADAELFNALLAEELARLHTRKVEPFDQTLRHGTQTVGRLFSAPSAQIAALREAIAEAVRSYISDLPDDPAHPTAARKAEDFTFFGSWSCRLRSSGYHTNHVHTQGWISSAYYVAVPEEVDGSAAHPGWLKFGESNLALGERDCAAHFVRPRVGLLALFPSFYWHGTVPFASEKSRMTIAFDVVPGNVVLGEPQNY